MNKVLIHNIELPYTVVRRRVKYPRLEFKTENLSVILPLRYKDETVLLKKHEKWIYKKHLYIKRAIEESNKNSGIVKRRSETLVKLVNKAIERFVKVLQIRPRKMVFKTMRSKWGSCSSKGQLTFNYLIGYLPNRLVAYVVYHEMAHLLVRKHNSQYWGLIKSEFSDYQDCENQLLSYWFLIQKELASSRSTL